LAAAGEEDLGLQTSSLGDVAVEEGEHQEAAAVLRDAESEDAEALHLGVWKPTRRGVDVLYLEVLYPCLLAS
jgi:hypothetical protein